MDITKKSKWKNRITSYKIYSIFLTLVLILTLFSSCKKNTGDKDNSIGINVVENTQDYQEYIISQLSDIVYILGFKQIGDSYVVLGDTIDGMLEVYRSLDSGLNWTKDTGINMNLVQKYLPEDAFVTVADIDMEGNLIFGYDVINAEGQRIESKLMLFPKRATKPIEIVDIGTKNTIKIQFEKTDIDTDTGAEQAAEYFYAYFGEKLHKYDLNGTEIYSIGMPDLMDFCEAEEDLFVLTKYSLCIYDKRTGKLLEEDSYLSKVLENELSETYELLGRDIMNCKNILKSGVDGEIYLMLSSGIYSYMPKKSMIICEVVSQENGFERGNVFYDYIVAVSKGTAKLQEETFVTICSGNGRRQIIAYSTEVMETNYQEEDATGLIYLDEPEAEITVYSLRYAAFMVDLIAEFQTIHPNIMVEYRYGVSDESGISVRDAINALNTELLAGEGPDVILMDGLNVRTYTESGMLMELSEVYNEILAENPKCLENVMSTYRTEDGIYAIPSKHQFPVLVALEEDIDTITDIKSLTAYIQECETAEYGNGLNIYEWEILFEILYPKYSIDIVDFEGNYDEVKLKEFLIDIKALWDELLKHTTGNQIEEWRERAYGGDHPMARQSITYMHPLYNRPYTGQNIAICTFESNMAVERFYSIKHNEASDNEELRYRVFGDNDKNTYTPYVIFAINQNSGSKDASVSFVKEMFSVNIQSQFVGHDSTYFQGNPVNMEGVRVRNEVAYGWGSPGGTLGDIHYGIAYYFQYEEDMEEYIELLKTLNSPANANIEITMMIKESMADYMNGEASLEDTMDTINSLLELYLNE